MAKYKVRRHVIGLHKTRAIVEQNTTWRWMEIKIEILHMLPSYVKSFVFYGIYEYDVPIAEPFYR